MKTREQLIQQSIASAKVHLAEIEADPRFDEPTKHEFSAIDKDLIEGLERQLQK